MKITLRSIMFAASLALPLPVMAAEFTDKQRVEIGEIVREYLLANPQVLEDVSKELQARQEEAETRQRESAVSDNADELFRQKADLVVGNPKGDVTMVEFFDYNCGWCKKGLPEVLSLIESDKNLRVVLKEFPIFGGDSDYAAKAALASQAQGKYWDFHLAMMGHEGKLTAANVDEIAVAQGLDLPRLKKDMEAPDIAATIARTAKLAQSMAIGGTPAFIIDRKVIPGYLPKDGLAAAIDEVRKAGGCAVC